MTDLVIGADADIDVDWDDATDFSHSLATVTDHLYALDYRWGALRRSNPKRPLLDPGSGSMVLTGDTFASGSAALTEAQLRGRHRFRIRHNPRSGATVPGDVTGWCIREDRPTTSRSVGRRSVWRLVGQLDDDVRADIAVTQPSSPLASTAAAFTTLLNTAAGRMVTVVSPAVSLGAFNFNGRRGEFISEIARVLAATPYGGRSGGISIISAAHQTQQARIGGDTLAVTAVTTQSDTAQIFNQLTSIEAAAMTGETQRIELVLLHTPAAALAGPGSFPRDQQLPLQFTGSFASLGDDWTYTVADPTSLEFIIRSAHIVTQYYSSGRNRQEYRVSAYGYVQGGLAGPGGWYGVETLTAQCTATAVVNLLTVTVTVSAVAATTIVQRWGKQRRATTRNPNPPRLNSAVMVTVPWNGLTSGAVILNPTNSVGAFPRTYVDALATIGVRNLSPDAFASSAAAAAEMQPLSARVAVQVTASRTAGAAFSSRTVAAAESVALWGPRPLVLPAWLQSAPAATLQSIVNSFANPRDVHVIDLAMPQPTTAATARVASLEPGQLMPVRISDPRTATDINAVCVIRSVEWRLRARTRSICRITVVETQIAPTVTAPAVPAGLALAPADRQLAASWATVIDADTYDLRHKPSTGSTWTQITGITATTRTITGLTNGTAVDVQVRAVNTAGTSNWSPTVTATPAAALQPPPTPTNVRAVPGDSSTGLFWNAAAGATGYRYRQRLSGDTDWGAAVDVGTATSSAIFGLTNGTTYEWQIQAYNAAGDSGWSAAVDATPVAPPMLQPPGAPGAPSGTATATTIPAAWTAPTTGGTPATYDLRHRAGTSGDWTTITGITGTSRTITGLTAETSYQVEVRAVNAAGSSSWVRSTFTTSAAPTSNGPVLSLGTRFGTFQQFTWTYAFPGGSTPRRFELQTRAVGAADWGASASIGSRGRQSYRNIGTGAVEARVRAVYQLGAGDISSDWSNTVTRAAVSGPGDTPDPPMPVYTAHRHSIDAAWTPLDWANSYFIGHRRSGSGDEFSVLHALENPATVDGLDAGTDYDVRMRASYYTPGEEVLSDWTTAITVTTLADDRLTLDGRPLAVDNRNLELE
ncbi:MAG: fibronectin type III domain-containing protein [bacterium]|nr:fibronectin type III domain-containing protein [bacterium]